METDDFMEVNPSLITPSDLCCAHQYLIYRHYFYDSEKALKHFLHNVALNLKPGTCVSVLVLNDSPHHTYNS